MQRANTTHGYHSIFISARQRYFISNFQARKVVGGSKTYVCVIHTAKIRTFSNIPNKSRNFFQSRQFKALPVPPNRVRVRHREGQCQTHPLRIQRKLPVKTHARHRPVLAHRMYHARMSAAHKRAYLAPPHPSILSQMPHHAHTGVAHPPLPSPRTENVGSGNRKNLTHHIAEDTQHSRTETTPPLNKTKMTLVVKLQITILHISCNPFFNEDTKLTLLFEIYKKKSQNTPHTHTQYSHVII